MTWQKPGADQQTVSRDSFSCREAAQAAAMQRYPYRAGLGVGAGGAVIGQQQDVVDRSTMEAAHYNACMQERGYQRQ